MTKKTSNNRTENQVGRRNLSGGTGETARKTIRVSESDWRAWQTKAKKAGKSVSELIRELMNSL